ncbi:MAG TPA: glycosyltransferase family 4 protein [Candidatus Didemnitutus sp.]|nr:glycosyltransferase family 4 protein [Candidatus Didemnitutus sp.]
MAISPAPRLVMVTLEFYPHRGGIAVYAAEMALAAVRAGYAVEVWAPSLTDGVPEREWPFHVRRLAIDGSHGLKNQWVIARELGSASASLQDAILYIPEPGPLLSLLVLQFLDTLPTGRLVVTLHGSEILKLGMRPLATWSTRRLLSRAEAIGVVSNHTRQLFEEFFPGLTPKLVVTPGALRSDFVSQEIPSSAPAHDKIVILTVARIHPRKGQLEVIEALKALPERDRSRIEYWLVGGHSKEGYDDVLRESAADAGFPVRFLGDVPDEDLGPTYAQADIFAMTSVPHKLSVEGFGLAYLEAGAHGLPVVAHAIGGVPEAVRDGESGLLTRPGDRTALTAAFARLIGDPALRRKLGEQGRALALQRTWQDNATLLFGPPSPPSAS